MGKLNSVQLRVCSPPPATVKIELPASKSISNRLLIMRALSGNKIKIENLSRADDSRLLATALKTPTEELWLGHAGTALRFATAYAAISPGQRILTGSNRLSQRPMQPLIDALRSCGAAIKCIRNEGYAPLRIRGKKLSGTDFHIDGSQSSQFLTALLLIAPYLDSTSRFFIPANQVSRPYLAMTIDLMSRAGAHITTRLDCVSVTPKHYQPSTLLVEPDWSAASYFYALAAMMPGLAITMPGLSPKSIQGDRQLASIYTSFGVETTFDGNSARIQKTTQANPPSVLNLLDCPDLAQTIAVTACALKIPIRLQGLQTLRIKETDRLDALKNELAKCGAIAEIGNDYLQIQSFETPQTTPRISTYDDHRMAMAFAPLAAKYEGLEIENPEVVSKSFPGFWNALNPLISAKKI